MSERMRFWWAWTLSCAAGEILGIGVAAGIAVTTTMWLGEPTGLSLKLLVLAAMIAAGALEGLAIGFLQWRVLRRKLPAITARTWISSTVTVAMLGWFLGMLPPTLQSSPQTAAAQPPEFSPAQTAGLALGFGLAVRAVFGFAQWVVLRRYARRAGRWVVGNALGWGAVLPWIFLAASLPQPGPALPLILPLGASAGLLSGLSIGAVTGTFLLGIEPKR